MKLWQKGNTALAAVEKFTVGRDREFDLLLAPFDVLGSIAHVVMLGECGLIPQEEVHKIVKELRLIYAEIASGSFQIQPEVEDVHSQVELLLTQRLGEAGKKIHSARSRNDQVLVDVKLFLRHRLQQIMEKTKTLFGVFQEKSELFKEHLLPGYTHLQLAMPSSFGLWLGAYAESLVDDLLVCSSAYAVCNKNPLGSAAGYGSSFPIQRKRTTELLGFSELNYNVVYAQMGRGKAERITAAALAGIAETLSRFCMDACLYMNQNFGFISFPDELTTGSSIMPHKKNPDVLELIRSYCNRMKALPNEIAMMTTNLPSGYHRDLQLLKEHLFPAFDQLEECMDSLVLMLTNISIKENLLEDPTYQYLFSVEEVNKAVLGGMPFRDAYKKIGLDIEQGTYQYQTSLHHTHEGSIGNLCTQEISQMMEQVFAQLPFERVQTALNHLLKGNLA
jgi:argininosuccinate lyase